MKLAQNHNAYGTLFEVRGEGRSRYARHSTEPVLLSEWKLSIATGVSDVRMREPAGDREEIPQGRLQDRVRHVQTQQLQDIRRVHDRPL